MLLLNHGPRILRHRNGGSGTLAERATSEPIGPARPYDSTAVANRMYRGSGLRIGEQTACTIRDLGPDAPERPRCTSETYEWCTSPDRNVTESGAGPRLPSATSRAIVATFWKPSWNAAQCSRSTVRRSHSPKRAANRPQVPS